MDFVVQLRSAAKIPHADVLSRHVGIVTQKNCIDKETITQEKSRDAFCTKQSPGSYSSKNELFLDEEGAMYRRQRNGNHQLVIPEVLIEDIIRENHSPLFVAHPGVHRTYSLITLNYWWPGMRGSIENFCEIVTGVRGAKVRGNR